MKNTASVCACLLVGWKELESYPAKVYFDGIVPGKMGIFFMGELLDFRVSGYPLKKYIHMLSVVACGGTFFQFKNSTNIVACQQPTNSAELQPPERT